LHEQQQSITRGQFAYTAPPFDVDHRVLHERNVDVEMEEEEVPDIMIAPPLSVNVMQLSK
jgi:hypothetical protein